jgi:hypothetical protein
MTMLNPQIRVTEVLDYFKEPWYVDWVVRVGKKEAGRIGREAMKIGARVDELIKTKGAPKAKDSDEVRSCFTAWGKFLEVYKPVSLINGERFYATIGNIKYTGEPDLIIDGVLTDLKCAVKISPKYWVQVAMYCHALKIDRMAVLRLDKVTGSYEYVVKDFDGGLVDVWFGLAKAYLYLREDDDDGNSD